MEAPSNDVILEIKNLKTYYFLEKERLRKKRYGPVCYAYY